MSVNVPTTTGPGDDPSKHGPGAADGRSTTPAGSADDWATAAAAVLAKSGRQVSADVDSVLDALSRRTAEGIVVPALGSRAAKVPAERRSTRVGAWDIRIPMSDPDPVSAAAALLADLEGGATSVWLTVGPTGIPLSELATVLEPVLLDLAPVALEANGEVGALELARAFGAVLQDRALSPAPGGALGADPLARSLLQGSAEADLSECAELVALAQQWQATAFTVNAIAAHEAGAGEAAEIAYAIAAGISYLRALDQAGVDPQQAARLIDFRFAATVEQFPTIAKLRAARQLWSQVLRACEIPAPPPMRQHAVTSRLMTTRYDPWVNMLRATIATFAAGAGGADIVTTLPFDAAIGIPEAFGRRIARNVSHLLIGEAHAAATADPAGGAGAVEQLTDALVADAWCRVQEIEAAGGLPAALPMLREQYQQAGQQRTQRIGRRKQAIIGVTEFADLHQAMPERRARSTPWPAGWASPFEELRDRPAGHSVYLACLGSLASHGVRAAFASSALAAIGVRTEQGAPAGDVDELLAGYRERPATVVVIAGSDAAYAGADPSFTGELTGVSDALRQAGVRTVYLAGKPSEPQRRAVDGSIALGEDLLALAEALRPQLHTPEAN